MQLRFYAKNFRVLKYAEWRPPQGVCLLVGANGTGKTSLLEALDLIRYAYPHSLPKAVQYLGGIAGLRRLSMSPEDSVIVGLESGAVRWELELSIAGGSLQPRAGEKLWLNDSLVLRREPGAGQWTFRGQVRSPHDDDEDRVCLRLLQDRESPEELQPFIKSLKQLKIYDAYWMRKLRERGSPNSSDSFLHPQGTNLFAVLRNWRSEPVKYEGRFDWVLRNLRKAFPGMLSEIELVPEGQSITARFYRPDHDHPDAGLPIHRAADGLMTGLLHLTALAGLERGGVLAIDEMENQLHPHAIRALLQAFRERAEQQDQTVLLTTHSPVLMNLFRDTPERLFVMEEGQPTVPVALDQLYDPEWLYSFALGDLYAREDFGAPRPTDKAQMR